MKTCETALSELPEDFPSMPVAEAVELLAANHIVDTTFYFECRRRHEALVEWIEDDE